MTDITSASQEGGDVVLRLTHRATGAVRELRCDFVLLGTGFDGRMPGLVRALGHALDLDEITVNRQYRLQVPGPASAACYLQGVNEATHGIADSLLSVQAARGAEIVQDIVSARAEFPAYLTPSVPVAIPS
jgi:L-ornithine N5-oxygenase